MNYDHLYHAGNFADVFKHLIIIACLEKLKQKTTPFVYIDAHGASPLADLNSQAAQKTQEARQGIIKIFNNKNLSETLQHYLKCVAEFNQDQKIIRYYPSSSALAALLKRPQDRVIVNELAETPYHALKKFFKNDPMVHCHQQDAYLLLKALLPPQEKRGLVLIDPSYENLQEFSLLEKDLPPLIQRWPQGIYAIWYPIKNRQSTDRFVARMKNRIPLPQMNFVLQPWSSDVKQRLGGTGVLLINPPWQIEKVIHPLIGELTKIFTT